MTEHTPGPWRLSSGDYPFIYRDQSDEYGPPLIVATVFKDDNHSEEYDPNGVEGASAEVGRANASLIAAAPELLEACKGLIEDDLHAMKYWIIARAAIDKAEGYKCHSKN
jgi:hypothetical protein